MSTFTDYEPGEFLIERRQNNNAVVGTAIVGRAKVGSASSTDWEEVPSASVATNSDYTPTRAKNADGSDADVVVLIIGAQTATMNVSYYDDTTPAPVKIFDEIRMTYRGLIRGGPWIVDSIKKKRVPDPKGDASLNGYIRVDLTCTLLGPYASAMNTTVCLGPVPAETPLQRLQRYGIGVSFPPGWEH